ncbi:lysophospholipid acyltransferase family protein, partial [Desulfococcaceae bacterium HSG8]|nr:lysophospholipid acyltransferase family protein [Desulfococcaceae bacterium HSG8]
KPKFFTIIFYFLFILFSAFTIPLFSLFVAVMGLFMSRRRTMRRFRRSISWYGWFIIRILPFPFVRIHYKDYEKERRGPCIVVSNHRSSSDPFLMACLPCEIVQVVNIWPFRIPVIGRYARWAGYLSIREMPFEEFSQEALELLNQGVSIAAFPEGTRSGGREMGHFHSAIFRLALQARYPLVPVCITGNENIPSRDFVMHPGTITIHKLPALLWEDYKDMTPFKLKNRVREIIAEEIDYMEKNNDALPGSRS